MNDNKNSFFTAGELAQVFGISKQALLYYDKIGLCSPAFIADNGYRHYSIDQYMELELILKMRALDFSIAQIKEYIANRDKEIFLKLIQEKQKECRKIIAEKHIALQQMQTLSANINKDILCCLKQPLLIWQDEQTLLITPTTKKDSAKERVMLFTMHAQDSFENLEVLNKNVGWIIDRKGFLAEEPTRDTIAYFSFASSNKGKDSQIKTLPSGMYIELYFQGTFYDNAKELPQLINKFLNVNDLHAIGDVYVLPIENHLLHNDPSKYINKVFLQVEKIQ